jgi:hypothetical protein
MNTRSWCAVMALVAGMATMAAADPPKAGLDSSQSKLGRPAVDSLNLAVDQWYDAVLAGDDGRAREREKQLLKSLLIDIDQAQERVRQLSSQLAADNQSVQMDSALHPLKDSLSQLNETLQSKRVLVDAITRTDAFSNKYRLLGDYVGLLRREVGLPKLKLAVDKKSEADKN